MTEYIEREDAIEAVRHAWAKGLEPSQYVEIIPAVDVEPVRHGRWIVKHTALGKGYTICSNCGYASVVLINGHFSHLDLTGIPRCPYCGAKMDEEARK